MTVTVIRNEDQRKQQKINGTLLNLLNLPKVKFTKIILEDGTIDFIRIFHEQEFVPDFEFKWCPYKKHYRVYIQVAHTEHFKENAGYCICTIPNGLAAAGFVMLYSFLHKHRANNKSSAE